MIVWCHKLSEKDLENTEVGPIKFYCVRKGKHGINLMATCDHLCRFIDIGLSHPGSTSDCLVFATSELITKLEKEAVLVPGLSLHGGNAYVSTNFMAAPFKGVISGPKDSHNFFQSQLRVHMECTFSILVHR